MCQFPDYTSYSELSTFMKVSFADYKDVSAPVIWDNYFQVMEAFSGNRKNIPTCDHVMCQDIFSVCFTLGWRGRAAE